MFSIRDKSILYRSILYDMHHNYSDHAPGRSIDQAWKAPRSTEAPKDHRGSRKRSGLVVRSFKQGCRGMLLILLGRNTLLVPLNALHVPDAPCHREAIELDRRQQVLNSTAPPKRGRTFITAHLPQSRISFLQSTQRTSVRATSLQGLLPVVPMARTRNQCSLALVSPETTCRMRVVSATWVQAAASSGETPLCSTT